MSASTDILSTETPLPCPSCEKLFRLPEGFAVRNSVACPHCDKQVTGQQILDAIAPKAKIIDGGDENTDLEVATPSISRAAANVRPSRSFDEQDFVIPKPLKTAIRRSRSRHPERKKSGGQSSRKTKKKESSAYGELIKIVFGGVLALPIAQLVLWWGFNSDPIGLAPATSKVAAFIVPAKLRPGIELDQEEGDKPNKDMPANQKMNDHNIPFELNPG